jgi:hypothetical protein
VSASSPDDVDAGSAAAGTPQSQLTDSGVVSATNAQAAPDTTLKPSGWIVTFQTADQMFAGYDGQVYAQLGRGRGLVTWDLPITHFVRNGRYSLPPSQRWIPPGPPDAISMSCQDKWWSDHWTLDYVSWWELSTNTVVRFDFQNQDVPMLSEHPSMVTANASQPMKVAGSADAPLVIYVWRRQWTEAMGHASMALADGTYISWWPENGNESLYGTPAYQNRTLADDVRAEGTNKDGTHVKDYYPDFVIGLTGFDQSAIKSWWTNFKPNHTWHLYNQNCSTTVYQALVAGGLQTVFPPATTIYPTVPIWWPAQVASLAESVIEYQAGTWSW